MSLTEVVKICYRVLSSHAIDKLSGRIEVKGMRKHLATYIEQRINVEERTITNGPQVIPWINTEELVSLAK